jgi:signal transduction histidine kinase
MKKEARLHKRQNEVFAEAVDYQSKLLATSFEIRIFNVIACLICIDILKYLTGVRVPIAASVVLYVWLFTSVLFFIPLRMGMCKTMRVLDNLHFAYYFPGVIFTTIAVFFLGGSHWAAFSLYFFDLVYANVLMTRVRGAMITALVVLGYASVAFLEYAVIFPQQREFLVSLVSRGGVEGLVVASMLVQITLFCLLSFSTGLFSKMKQDREKSLLESKNNYAAKSHQLEEITISLRKNIAENKYLKRAAMGYVEKKEYELTLVKKDLEDQIDKLRKTQKSMFFMIEDLNEMSAQLKETRDHLEDKVRERTDELLSISSKLHRSERLAFLGKLAGSVTHELRNPLAVLKNAAYFLDKKFAEKNDEKVNKYMDIVKKELNVIDSIIDDIMGFAKTRAPQLEDTNVRELAENAISALNVPELVKVVKEFDEVPKVKIDANQVMHAVMNIANNAIVAMSGNGVLTFRVRENGEYVSIEIGDSGPGIPPDQRDLIFEPLYSSKPKGTGLGLPISKMMIENQDGKIEFESELGEGTVFKILLPMERKVRGRTQ